jgi:hypothetical protein
MAFRGLHAFGAVFIAAAAATCIAATETTLEDPIFGLQYDQRVAQFPRIATRKLLPVCRTVLADLRPLPRSLTLYAEYQAKHIRILVVGARDNQKLLIVRDRKCSAGVPIMSILQRHHDPREPIDSPEVTDEEDVALLEDAFGKYSAAFGSKVNFLQWLDMETKQATAACGGEPESSCPTTFRQFPPKLQNALREFRSE